MDDERRRAGQGRPVAGGARGRLREVGTGTTAATSERYTCLCLWAGVVAPVLFVAVFTLDGALQPGYSAFQEAISYLDLGQHGWIQRGNFALFGLLLIAFAVGFARQMRPIVARTWLYAGAAFLVLSGAGWIMAGVFVPNPYGTPQDSPHAVLHTVAFETVFLPYAAACLLLGVALVRTAGWRGYGWYSQLNGVLLGIVPVVGLYYFVDPRAFNTDSPGGGLTNRLALFVAFAWYVVMALRVLRLEQQGVGPRGRLNVKAKHPGRGDQAGDAVDTH